MSPSSSLRVRPVFVSSRKNSRLPFGPFSGEAVAPRTCQPCRTAKRATREITAWTKLPPRSLFVHPAPDGNVAVGWLSPVAGKVTVRGRVKDAHPGGPDGVGWVLERFAIDARPHLDAMAAAADRQQALEKQKAELVKTAPKQDVAFAVVEGKPADARLHLRGDRTLGEVTHLSFRYRLAGTDHMLIEVPNRSTGARHVAEVKGLEKGKWAQATVDLTAAPGAGGSRLRRGDRVEEIQFLLPRGAELLLDDVLLYEPGRPEK